MSTARPNSIRKSKMVTLTLSPEAMAIYEQMTKGLRAEQISIWIVEGFERNKASKKRR